MRNLLGLPAWLVRASARALLLALSVSALGPVVHGFHQDECEPAFVFHDESQHRIEAVMPDDAPAPGDHCLACHFARSSRGPAAWEPSGLITLDQGVLLSHSDGLLVAAPSSAPLPARAPPQFAL